MCVNVIIIYQYHDSVVITSKEIESHSFKSCKKLDRKTIPTPMSLQLSRISYVQYKMVENYRFSGLEGTSKVILSNP